MSELLLNLLEQWIAFINDVQILKDQGPTFSERFAKLKECILGANNEKTLFSYREEVENLVRQVIEICPKLKDLKVVSAPCYAKGHIPLNQTLMIYEIPSKWLFQPKEYSLELKMVFLSQYLSPTGFFLKIRDLPQTMIEAQDKVYQQWEAICKFGDHNPGYFTKHSFKESEGNSGFAVGVEVGKVDYYYSVNTSSMNQPLDTLEEIKRDPKNTRYFVNLDNFIDWEASLVKMAAQRDRLIVNLHDVWYDFMKEFNLGLSKKPDLILGNRGRMIRYLANDSNTQAAKAHIDRGTFTYLSMPKEQSASSSSQVYSTDTRLYLPLYSNQNTNHYAVLPHGEYNSAYVQGGVQLTILSLGEFKSNPHSVCALEGCYSRFQSPIFYNLEKSSIIQFTLQELQKLKFGLKLPQDVSGFVYEDLVGTSTKAGVLDVNNSVPIGRLFYRSHIQAIDISNLKSLAVIMGTTKT